jgi:hypothetical protein
LTIPTLEKYVHGLMIADCCAQCEYSRADMGFCTLLDEDGGRVQIEPHWVCDEYEPTKDRR